MVKQKKKRFFSLKFVLFSIIFVILVFLLILRVFYFWELNHKPYSEVTKVPKTNLKLYTNKIAKFSIQFPEYLSIKEDYSMTPEIGKGFSGGYVCFYDSQNNTKEKECKNGLGFFYALPYINGKGGGCDPEYITHLIIQGKKTWLCMDDKGIDGPIYWKHPTDKIEVTLDSSFGGRFTKIIAINMLTTFQFIHK